MEVKKVAYTKWLKCVNEDENRRLKDMHKTAKIEAKLAITSTKMAAFECLYAEIGNKGEDKRLYRLAKEGREKLVTWVK